MMRERFERELAQIEAADNLRALHSVGHIGRCIEVDGREYVNLASNDYLGVSGSVPLREEFLRQTDVERLVMGSASSRLLTGNFAIYDAVEQTLCEMFGSEAALVFNSGYHANTGILPAVCDAHTLIVADKLVHASIIDGIRLAGCDYTRYRHSDYEALGEILKAKSGRYESVIVVTESVFSMDGDVADLRRLVELKQQYPNVALYVDEAHGVGVMGARGLGVAEEQSVVGQIDFLVGTFGKAVGSMGAYVVCRDVVRRYLINRMRTLIFSTALPPVVMEWTRFVLQRLPQMERERESLHRMSAALRRGIEAAGYDMPSTSHIVPMTVGDNESLMRLGEELRGAGYYVSTVRPPTVPKGGSRVRFSLTASLTDEDVEGLIAHLPAK